VDDAPQADRDHRRGPGQHDHRPLILQLVTEDKGDEGDSNQGGDGHRAEDAVHLVDEQGGVAAVIELVREEDGYRRDRLDARQQHVIAEGPDRRFARQPADGIGNEESQETHGRIHEHQAEGEC